MNSDQWRVLGILAAVLGVEGAASPPFRAAVRGLGAGLGLVTGKNPTAGQSGAAPNPADLTPGGLIANAVTSGIIGYAVAGLALVALAGVAPNVATWLAVLALAYALLSHGGAVVDVLNTAHAGVNLLAGRPASGQ